MNTSIVVDLEEATIDSKDRLPGHLRKLLFCGHHSDHRLSGDIETGKLTRLQGSMKLWLLCRAELKDSGLDRAEVAAIPIMWWRMRVRRRWCHARRLI